MRTNTKAGLSDYFYNSAEMHADARRARARAVGDAILRGARRLRAWVRALGTQANGLRHHTPSLG